ncbi:hypothetical protein BKA58DRAFT_318141 [Alternaria rosae]|uniref:uncharacterized protein n=1 Tax=Alternaria rosae TaxID=1187941 RepID=UPI001E8DED33|nr:uncharacterized protein BKA58DRAFT_318141 [Alternaria rosae]KAH6868627.1 hypothetical protein BKA58DRAFT_318141 [Alternaria rosae]
MIKKTVQLRTLIIDKAIPPLLRPLETDGKSVSACLVYGDLWDGNTGVDREQASHDNLRLPS